METSKVGIKGTGAVDVGNGSTNRIDSGKGPTFKETLLGQFENVDAKKPAEAPKVEKPVLKFSNHALDRMNQRGIHFTPEDITKIEQAAQKAMEKGAKETLVLTDASALIVNLKDKTVVTVMDKSMLKENVFTNIDSTVVL